MKDKEKQIIELMKDKEFMKLVRLIDNTHPFYVETIALRVFQKYQPKLPEDSVVIPNKITEETSAEDLIKIAKYNDKIRKAERKKTIEKIYKDIRLFLSDETLKVITRYFKEILGVEIKE